MLGSRGSHQYLFVCTRSGDRPSASRLHPLDMCTNLQSHVLPPNPQRVSAASGNEREREKEETRGGTQQSGALVCQKKLDSESSLASSSIRQNGTKVSRPNVILDPGLSSCAHSNHDSWHSQLSWARPGQRG